LKFKRPLNFEIQIVAKFILKRKHQFTCILGFTTPLDEEDSPEYIDEYIVFQDVMQSKKLLLIPLKIS